MRHSRKGVESLMRQLAAVLNKPLDPCWIRQEDGALKATVGAWYLDSIRPGDRRLYQVHEISNENGGVRCPLGEYRHYLSEMGDLLKAGLAVARELLGEEEFRHRLNKAFAEEVPA